MLGEFKSLCDGLLVFCIIDGKRLKKLFLGKKNNDAIKDLTSYFSFPDLPERT